MLVCKGVKKDGARCGRKIEKGDLCWQHEGQTLVAPVKKVYKTPIRVKIDNARNGINQLDEEMKDLGERMNNPDDEVGIDELSVMMGNLSVRRERLDKYLKDCLEKERCMTRSERTLKVRHFEKDGSSLDKVRGCVKETNEKAFRKMMDRELGKFRSEQKTFEYKKWRNKKT